MTLELRASVKLIPLLFRQVEIDERPAPGDGANGRDQFGIGSSLDDVAGTA
jgi:hypothetical protein